MNNDDIFNNLRTKLDVLGYRQPLPLAACSLVAALFEDLVKTTESLRDAKLQISNFQEEKSCWELGVEPYKCDNSRLLAECNELHLKIVKQKDEFEEKLCEYVKKLRNLEADKRCLEDHCAELEAQIRHLTLRNFDDKLLKTKKNGANMSKKPFITTVKAGVLLPNPGQDPHHPRKCSKCNSIGWTKQSGGAPNAEIDKLQDDVREKSDQVTLYKKKVEERDREINRLNNLLTGGRPAPALAKDCCYKNVGTLSEDVGKLQREKAENLRTIRELEESMHEAKQRALDLAEKNKKLEKELTEFKDAALSVEQQANEEIAKKEGEIEKLCDEIRKLRRQQNENPQRKQSEGMQNSVDDKRLLNERINKLILREKELEAEIDKVCKKYTKLKTKMASLEKEKEAQSTREDKQTLTTELDEERIRLKSERDLFQKEYLRLVEKSGNASEIYCLRSQLKEKEDELIHLRSELCALRTQTCRTNHDRCTITPSTSVQAAILRAERERDVVCAELDRVKVERDLLREKLRCTSDTQITETDRYAKEIQELYTKISNLEKENHNLLSAQIPGQTHITLMKEEIEELKKRLHEFQSENSKLNTHYNQLKILHEQTERALVDHQNKLAISEANLRNAESRLNALNSNRDSSRSEVCALRNEMSVLKKMNMTLEQEKDKLVSELDNKTEKLFRMEDDVKTLKRCKEHLECTVSELKEKLGKATNEKRERESELHETSTESKTLRQTVGTLKEVRDQVLAENSRISNELADCKAELSLTRKKLKESEKEVDRLKQQLQQYVQKVQKAEDLLLQKEREREEMLDHYRSLSHEAIALEGNNQGLELEAAEQKRQLIDAEEEISRLKRELSIKECTIQKLEKQVTHLSSQICCLEKQLEEAYDDQKLLKTDLDAIKELCEKLDLQSEKQNAELQERGEIISKLEKENIELRTNHPSSSRADKAATDILQDLLAKSRQELECERRNICKLAQEKLDLRKKIEEMQKRIEQERKKATERDALAKEYHVQLQELQRNLTDDRFQRARSREQSPRSLRSRGYAGYSQTSSTPRNSSMCQNQRTSHSEKSRRKSISPDYCSKERRSQYCRETASSNSPQCSSSKKRAKQEENQKFMRDTLSKIHPNKRTKLVNDINTFLNDGKIRLSYNEELFFDEDTDDIIVRRHRKVKTYTVNGEEILENESLANLTSRLPKDCQPGSTETRQMKKSSKCTKSNDYFWPPPVTSTKMKEKCLNVKNDCQKSCRMPSNYNDVIVNSIRTSTAVRPSSTRKSSNSASCKNEVTPSSGRSSSKKDPKCENGYWNQRLSQNKSKNKSNTKDGVTGLQEIYHRKEKQRRTKGADGKWRTESKIEIRTSSLTSTKGSLTSHSKTEIRKEIAVEKKKETNDCKQKVTEESTPTCVQNIKQNPLDRVKLAIKQDIKHELTNKQVPMTCDQDGYGLMNSPSFVIDPPQNWGTSTRERQRKNHLQESTVQCCRGEDQRECDGNLSGLNLSLKDQRTMSEIDTILKRLEYSCEKMENRKKDRKDRAKTCEPISCRIKCEETEEFPDERIKDTKALMEIKKIINNLDYACNKPFYGEKKSKEVCSKSKDQCKEQDPLTCTQDEDTSGKECETGTTVEEDIICSKLNTLLDPGIDLSCLEDCSKVPEDALDCTTETQTMRDVLDCEAQEVQELICPPEPECETVCEVPCPEIEFRGCPCMKERWKRMEALCRGDFSAFPDEVLQSYLTSIQSRRLHGNLI